MPPRPRQSVPQPPLLSSFSRHGRRLASELVVLALSPLRRRAFGLASERAVLLLFSWRRRALVIPAPLWAGAHSLRAPVVPIPLWPGAPSVRALQPREL